MRFIIFITCLLSSLLALAAESFQINEEIPLKESNGGYWEYFILEEENPGVISENVINTGCTVSVSSDEDVLVPASYSIMTDEKISPSVWDRRWKRSINLEYEKGEINIFCRTHRTGHYLIFNPIDDIYINEVFAGFAEIK